jgi:uncharacterized protein (DUF4213/DUF364 family)
MKLIDDLISDLSNVDTDAKIRDVHVGYTWIGVLSRNCGVAKNLGERHDYMVRNIGRLTEKTASELAEYLKSWNMIEAGIGLAAVNSMIAPRGKELNVTDFLLENGVGKKIAMVGHFPMVNDLRKVADELWVFERQPQKGDLPDTAAEHGVLFDYGVDMIAGIRVTDEAMMMAKIAQGVGKVKQFKDVIEFLVITR